MVHTLNVNFYSSGHGDVTKAGINVGCVELLNTVQKRVKPKYHLFGHVHEG